MANEQNGKNLPVSAPIGALGMVLVLGLAAGAYLVLSRDSDDAGASGQRAKSGGSMRRKIGLMTLIAAIENDTSRKLVLAVLKAMARRA